MPLTEEHQENIDKALGFLVESVQAEADAECTACRKAVDEAAKAVEAGRAAYKGGKITRDQLVDLQAAKRDARAMRTAAEQKANQVADAARCGHQCTLERWEMLGDAKACAAFVADCEKKKASADLASARDGAAKADARLKELSR